MAIREVLVFPNPKLRVKCKDVTAFDDSLKQLVEDMFETMYADEGIGLAAPQIGVNYNLVVMDVPKEEQEQDGSNKRVFINPIITKKDGNVQSEEGCLSVPEYRASVPRATTVSVEALDENGQKFTLDATGLEAICIQHELDHLNGRLFIDYLPTIKKEKLLKEYKQRAKIGN